MPDVIEIRIAKDFTDSPGGRSKYAGEFSGQEFRETFLEKHFKDSTYNYKIRIIFDGAYGYATSFLEEAFGGLARIYGKERVIERLEFVSQEEPLLIDEVKAYINETI